MIHIIYACVYVYVDTAVSKGVYLFNNLAQIELNEWIIKLLRKCSTSIFLEYLHFNEQLNWKSHIDSLSVKCCRILGILNRLKIILPLNIKIIVTIQLTYVTTFKLWHNIMGLQM